MAEGSTPLFINWRTGTPMTIVDGIPTGTLPGSLLVDGSVTNAKLANMADSTIKGRAKGAGTGAPQDLTASEVITLLGVREVLTAIRSYFVATTGSDSNNGLTALTPFLTIQKAIDVIASLDLSIYNVTVNVAAGTYTGQNILRRTLGAGTVTIVGATASTTIISTTALTAFFGTNVGENWIINTLTITTTGGGSGIHIAGTSALTCTNLIMGACTVAHFRIGSVARIRLFAYEITGGAALHWLCEFQSQIICVSVTVTVTGTPNFTTAFVSATQLSFVNGEAITFVGAATGVRYSATNNSLIFTNGGGANFFPGSLAGSVSNALYI